MNRKKILSLMLSMVLSIHLIPVTALAAQLPEEDNGDSDIMPGIGIEIPIEGPDIPIEGPEPDPDESFSVSLTAVPGEIPAGTINPTVTIIASELNDFAAGSLTVDTGSTGLTLSSADLGSSSSFVLAFQGTAKPGTIAVSLPGEAFALPTDTVQALTYIRITERAEPPEIPAESVTPVLTVTPSKIMAGAVDPTFIVTSSIDMQDFAGSRLSINTGVSGLTLAEADYDLESHSLVLHFQGTAQSGTITGDIPADVFWHADADLTGASFTIQIECSEEVQDGYYVIFVANNGKDSNKIVPVEKGKSIFLPECMFKAPEGKAFSGWRIHDELYRPGDRYNIHENTTITAYWKDAEDDKIQTVIDRIKAYLEKMTPEEKKDPDAIDLATLYAEAVCAEAASKTVKGKNVELSKASVSELAEIAEAACAAAESTLISGGVIPARELFKTVTLETKDCDIDIHFAGDITAAGIDKMSVKAPSYTLSAKVADLQADLGRGMSVKTKNTGTSANPKVQVDIPGNSMKNPLTLSISSTGKDTEHHVIQSQEKKTIVSKRNPITNMVDGKVNSSGTYSRQTAQKDFSDISKKSKEMQSAIRYLASHGVIEGTTSTTFSPDASINRAEIAKLLVTSLGKLSPQATTNFKDVTKKNWYYSAAASSQKNGLIKGFEDNTFRGTASINKVQIVAVASRVLTNEMKYKAPSNVSAYLEKYSDGVAKWAQPEVALATKERLVVLRSDGTFAGNKSMTRGDAAIVMYRMFQRIW